MLRTQQARATGLAGDFDGGRADPRRDRVSRARRLGHPRPRPARHRTRPGAQLDRRPGRRRAVLRRRPIAWPPRPAWVGSPSTPCTCRRSRPAAVDGPDAARAGRRARTGRDRGVRRPAGAALARLDPQQPRLGPPRLRPARRGARGLRAGRRGPGRRPTTTTAWLVARWCVGRTLRTLGRYDEALALMRELAADPVGAEDDYVHEEIAENEKAIAAGETP